ncbi:MAG: methyltransferase [Rikenellaceae bacterium]
MFKFKQFEIHQDKTPMKVGTDGVLIGAWTKVNTRDEYMLDIGSGTGLIALMLAQRSSAMIDAVEIDEMSAEQALGNFKSSQWSERINIHNVNISHFTSNFKYDLIVSNPPFFSDSLLPPDKRRTTARHTTSLTFSDLISSVERLMSPDGRFSLILPLQESALFEEEADGRLFLWRRCLVKSRENSDTKRVMSEYRLVRSSNIESGELAIREVGSEEYTRDYRTLTADFYLKF